MAIESFKKVLVLAPHTDDGELGCGGTIARLVDLGAEVHYAAFSTAEASVPPGFPKDILRREVMEATGTLGIRQDFVHIFGFEVRKLNYVRQEILEQLVRLRSVLEPDLVLTPSLNDIHQDHATVSTEAIRAFKFRSVWGYELIWNNLTFSTTAFVRLERQHVDRKISALSRYTSQAGRDYMSPDFHMALARTRGVQIGASYAESFEIIRWVM